jgi:DNA polymerase (family 10)
MKLHDARMLAERIQRVLAPFCLPDRCEIVGSIRRARPEVNDIDLVCLPKPGQLEALQQRCRAKAEVVQQGHESMIVRLTAPPFAGMQVDLWFAHDAITDMFSTVPSNWGSLVLCRTGSKEHNVWLAQRARAQDMKWETSRGLVVNPDTVKAKVIASETEEEIFKCLGLPFIPPVERERGQRTEVRGQNEETGAEARDWSAAFSTQDS